MRGGRTLYAELMGDAWQRLAPGVRAIHGGEGRVQGVFKVTRGAGWLPRAMATMFGMPRAAEQVAVTLAVVCRDRRELWTRAFGEHPLRTVQWAWRGLLMEALGLVICMFSLRAEGTTLVFDPAGTRFGWARLSMPVPRFLGPRITGRSEPCDGGVKVDVCIHAPGVGLLVRYEGEVKVESE
jgi:hypothetical protein